MRVAIDATPLLLRSAGVKTYIHNWLRSLQRLGGEVTVSVWPYLDPGEEYSHEKSPLSPTATYARLALLHAANYSGLPLLNWLGPQADVFHASNQLRNPPHSCRLTATLYDMTCWLVPETHSPRNVRASKLFAEQVMRRADGLIAISESTRCDAVRVLHLAEEKIEVIYPGVAEAFFRSKPWSIGEHGLTRPYVLFVGTIEPRKNLDTLLDAWGQLSPSLRAEFELVVAGPTGWASPRTLERLRSAENGVRYLGYIPEAELAGLTAGATVFVYPSLYEGFGLPLAQAMAAGAPVITSNTSSLPEVAGDAAFFVDPKSPGEITAAIERLLLSPGLRTTLAGNGRSRAQAYTWERCAKQSVAFFTKVCDETLRGQA